MGLRRTFYSDKTREYWLVINRDGSFQFVKETYLDVRKLIPGKTP